MSLFLKHRKIFNVINFYLTVFLLIGVNFVTLFDLLTGTCVFVAFEKNEGPLIKDPVNGDDTPCDDRLELDTARERSDFETGFNKLMLCTTNGVDTVLNVSGVIPHPVSLLFPNPLLMRVIGRGETTGTDGEGIIVSMGPDLAFLYMH